MRKFQGEVSFMKVYKIIRATIEGIAIADGSQESDLDKPACEKGALSSQDMTLSRHPKDAS